mgnify:CR=1 FL=1
MLPVVHLSFFPFSRPQAPQAAPGRRPLLRVSLPSCLPRPLCHSARHSQSGRIFTAPLRVSARTLLPALQCSLPSFLGRLCAVVQLHPCRIRPCRPSVIGVALSPQPPPRVSENSSSRPFSLWTRICELQYISSLMISIRPVRCTGQPTVLKHYTYHPVATFTLPPRTSRKD